ncbi:lysophospholipid acyltransferase family protein [Brevundimonas lutea]|uniref:lysophospholipid acyltransferase family protein n=1 Tax=Brevundimonas lutea TaxID=2293980 RepID=UPI000F02CAC5|nr:lysophospholipid acyltransferase family protein [Brevundimonas lutea]
MRPLRNPVVRGVLAFLLAEWMRFCFATIRWTHQDRDKAEAVWDAGGGVICAFWHQRIGLSRAGWPLPRAQEARALISLSPDGQFIADAVARLGIPAIRGSSQKAAAPERAKGGSAAMRDALRWLRTGALAITPDGPRGPARTMGEGLPVMARLSKRPVLFIGLACKPAIRLNSWDQAILPLPFGRGAIVWDKGHYPEGLEPEAVVPLWIERLNAVEARADRLVGATPNTGAAA